MATETETIYHHSCDLCGQEKPELELAHLYGPQSRKPGVSSHPQADICTECQGKPISAVLTFFTVDAAGQDAEYRTVRVGRS